MPCFGSKLLLKFTGKSHKEWEFRDLRFFIQRVRTSKKLTFIYFSRIQQFTPRVFVRNFSGLKNYKFPDKLAEDPEKLISNDPQLLEPLIKQHKKDYSLISNEILLKKIMNTKITQKL